MRNNSQLQSLLVTLAPDQSTGDADEAFCIKPMTVYQLLQSDVPLIPQMEVPFSAMKKSQKWVLSRGGFEVD